MPFDNPGSLSDYAANAVVAYLLEKNGVLPSVTPSASTTRSQINTIVVEQYNPSPQAGNGQAQSGSVATIRKRTHESPRDAIRPRRDGPLPVSPCRERSANTRPSRRA